MTVFIPPLHMGDMKQMSQHFSILSSVSKAVRRVEDKAMCSQLYKVSVVVESIAHSQVKDQSNAVLISSIT